MEDSEKNKPQKKHIEDIFREFTTPSRVLQSFTNLSNTVIQTALSGQSKFVFEILQNADDAFEDQHKAIEVKFILQDNYLIVHHNGKGFDFNDVERICDYASQIEEVKATDLSKTGYKGLGFKSLFNLSDCIYIYSNGYSFRFDKAYLPDAESKPWQVIPIWCRYDELPLHEKYSYDQPVNFILKVNDINQLEVQLRELVDQPELLLYMFRINKFSVNLNGEEHFLERKVEKSGVFNKIDFYKNKQIASTWLSRTFKRSVHKEVQTFVQGASRFIYPDKIKNAKKVPFTFALRSDETLQTISKVRGLCYSTLPTQLDLTLPYHINSLFILNLDRTQLHENEWNEFLLYQIGQLQLSLLKDLAEVNYLKNYVIELFVREILHPYGTFCKAFLKGFVEAKGQIGWLPAHRGPRLLKLGEAWIDETEFFKQSFQKIRDYKIFPFLIEYDLRSQDCLLSSEGEAKHFTYVDLFRDFSSKYYPQLTRGAYINFITYIYERLKGPPFYSKITTKLRNVHFLKAKNGNLLSPKSALLEESENPIPDFLLLNPIDNEYLPTNNIELIKDWLALLGARRLKTPIQVLRESILQWVDSGNFDLKISMKNHIGIMNYLVRGMEHFTTKETEKLKQRLLILTEGNEFKLAQLCYLPDAVAIKELADIIMVGEKVSSSYDLNYLKCFFIHVGVNYKLKPIDVFRKGILMWIKSGEINNKLTTSNYKPILEYIAFHYPTVEHQLTESEKIELKKMPVLTCGQLFQKAQVCYFDSAIPSIKGLEDVIAKNKLVSTNNVSSNVYTFLTKIGVSQKIAVIDLIRRSVLKWIQECDISRITVDNHHNILQCIADHWGSLNGPAGLKPKEKADLKRIPILTRSNKLRPACSCYWPPNSDGNYYGEIPMLENIVSADEFVSSNYQLKIITILLGDLGVHNLRFTDIYEKYSDHLIHYESVKWFFSQLVNYWNRNKTDDYKLLSCLQHKFYASSRLLAKNGKTYYSRELYSSRFDTMHDLDQYSVPLLEYEKLPDDLERWLGFKTALDLKCITQLLKTFENKPKLGEERTRKFFTTLLEQLRQKDSSEIKKYQLRLLSKENKLNPAEHLYYFIEEDATCVLDSCYLKRIHGMSHAETLELAELCGVHTIPFKQEITRLEETYDNSLKEFYLQRLPFIVVQESRELNENPSATLRRLYDKICSIKLYKCISIYVQYPFGNPIKIPHHFKDLTFYTNVAWKKKRTPIHKYLKEKLQITTNVEHIIDMEETISQDDRQDWLTYQKEEDRQKFYSIEKELRKLFNEGKEEVSESLNIGQPHSTDREKLFVDIELIGSHKEFTSAESSSDESSVTSVWDEPCVPTQRAIKGEGSGIYNFLDEPDVAENTTCSSDEDIESNNYSKEEMLQKVLSNERKERLKVDPFHHSSDKEKLFVDIELIGSKELTSAETSSDECSVDSVEDEPFILRQSANKDEVSGVRATSVDEREVITCPEISTVSIGINIEVSSELEIDRKKGIEPFTSPGIDSSTEKSLPTGFSICLLEATSEKPHMKWLSEKYVFTFLQDHYRNKYPNSLFNESDGLFTLRSHQIEILWLNASEDKGHPYDLVLKKEGKIKWLIEVKSTNDLESNGSFNMSHRSFVKRVNRLATKLPQHKGNYCIYRVFSADNSSTASTEELNCTALYKVVPLENL